MKFEASIEKNGEKVFESKGDKKVGEILAEMDCAVKKEIDVKK